MAKIRVADFIEKFLAEHDIRHVFTVVGGGAMHLNDAFGHSDRLSCIYHHHEQAAAMASESYYRVNNRVSCVCVTSGPGVTNAITGVAGAWVDSIPMLVISGQTKTELTIQHSGLNLRSLGNQEINTVELVKSITKYSVMIRQAEEIRYVLERAFYEMLVGRPGPVWIDIPVDIQGSFVEVEKLKGYAPERKSKNRQASWEDIDFIWKKMNESERPVIYAGSAIRTSESYAEFQKLIEKLKIPIVTCWNSIDVIGTKDALYVGRGGIMGDRAGNFAVQNSDFVLALGTRMNIYQVGYNKDTWARAAYCIMVDIDEEELKKPTIRIDKGICADVRDVILKLLETVQNKSIKKYSWWLEQCRIWKEKYPVVREKHYGKENQSVNVYAFIDLLSRMLPEHSVTVVANGSASVVGSQAFFIKEGCRFLMNCALSSMGYELPAAIGACVANDYKDVICIAGDGSMQMNLQELQTIRTNQLPIKIFLINNGGYHQIRQTQKNIFGNAYVGVGDESGDLEFPSCKGLAKLYGFPYFICNKNEELKEILLQTMEEQGALICEICVTKDQGFEPKSSVKKLPDGTLISPPLEDLAPFLSREELEDNMIIECIN